MLPLLEPTFRLSPLAEDFRIDHHGTQEAARQHHGNLHEVCATIINSGEKGRRGVLDWFATVLRQRRKNDITTVPIDWLMYNVVSVLNRFASPFIDINGTNVSILIPQIRY